MGKTSTNCQEDKKSAQNSKFCLLYFVSPQIDVMVPYILKNQQVNNQEIRILFSINDVQWHLHSCFHIWLLFHCMLKLVEIPTFMSHFIEG